MISKQIRYQNKVYKSLYNRFQYNNKTKKDYRSGKKKLSYKFKKIKNQFSNFNNNKQFQMSKVIKINKLFLINLDRHFIKNL